MQNPVVKKYVFYAQICTASPICVSNGNGDITDKDVIRDYEGNPFIPGSSLAGAMRSYINAESNVKCIFGNKETKKDAGDDRMSSLFVSDLVLSTNVKTTVRDSVKLTDDRTAETGAKFDMEVIDTGAEGSFILELVVREKDNERKMLDEVRTVMYGLEHREIRFGTKKTRGFGEVQLKTLKVKIFDSDNIRDYAKAYDDTTWSELVDEKAEWTEKPIQSAKYTEITIPVVLQGCISIRQYAAKKNLPDYVHVTANGKPVIPGTSMTGAIRHRISEMLNNDLKVVSAPFIHEMFGYVLQKDNQTFAQKSAVTISESVLEGSKPIELTRNGISRFESGAKATALFKELSYQGGETVIRIMVENNEHTDAMIGLLLLALKDLRNGFLTIGGQSSVGKGIFVSAGDININNEKINEDTYLDAASKWLGGKE